MHSSPTLILPDAPSAPAGYGMPDTIVSTVKRADDKRPGALCARPYCVAAALEAFHAGKPRTFLLTATGLLAVKHNRGGSKDRRARTIALLKLGTTCVWCDKQLDAETLQQDRIIESCEYSARNLVPACSCCNNHRNSNLAKASTVEMLATDTGRDRIAAVIARNPDFHA